MIQKRASSKYHSGGLWTNTCCSHPQPGEEILSAANRRLIEEFGISTELTNLFSFIYKTQVDNNLYEHELDHVLLGEYNDNPFPNPKEIEDWKYESLEKIQIDIELNPSDYTVWFREIFSQFYDYIKTNFKA